MKRFIALALLALLSLSIALPAKAGWYAEHDRQRGESSVASEPVDHGFMPGIIHDRAPRPEQGWTQGVPERSVGKTTERKTLIWNLRDVLAGFVWWDIQADRAPRP